ncbi:hypothetical protein N9T85_00125 [bacterium]|nr:hypothetical protein [bacterium]
MRDKKSNFAINSAISEKNNKTSVIKVTDLLKKKKFRENQEKLNKFFVLVLSLLILIIFSVLIY